MTKKNKILEIIRKSKKIEFWYEGEFFIYEYYSDSTGGFAFIFRGATNEKIYGPYGRDCTDEGRLIYNEICVKLLKKK
jgi:hypothetical protein